MLTMLVVMVAVVMILDVAVMTAVIIMMSNHRILCRFGDSNLVTWKKRA